MTLWIIEPRDPLIVRDGRPFGPNPGARAMTLSFPFPSTIVGALRNKAGLASNGHFDRGKIIDVLQHAMWGPLLVELGDHNTIADWLPPAPADALLLEPQQKKGKGKLAAVEGEKETDLPRLVQRFWLAPRGKMPATNMPDELELVGPTVHHPEKVSTNAPQFWHRDVLYEWLKRPVDGEHSLYALGIRGLEISTRMHVTIEPNQQTARDGALFQTSGLEFTLRNWGEQNHDTFVTRRLALAAWFDGPTPQFKGGFAPLGGERRLMRWSEGSVSEELFTPLERDNIFEQIEKDGRCRVMLLTPAYFTVGYRPSLSWVRASVTATLKAAVVPHMQTVSGWDMEADNGKDENGRLRPRGRPKPTRRLAPAGSVYFVEFPTGANVRTWLDATWMQNVSDDPQSCRDGFGLAIVGAWPQQKEE